ncbi:hypothetical protein GALMADRAFT_254390, partial [Galerina marginata CBS 339.88]
EEALENKILPIHCDFRRMWTRIKDRISTVCLVGGLRAYQLKACKSHKARMSPRECKDQPGHTVRVYWGSGSG